MAGTFRIIVITNGGSRLVDTVNRLLDTGVEVLIREPVLPEGLPIDRVILHSRMPGAMEVASAIHVSAGTDVSLLRARFAGPIGVSCHSPVEAAAARAAGADYTFLSPIFAARHGRSALGLECITGCIALGGVTHDTVSMCRRAGAVGVAVMGAVWDAADPVRAAEEFVRAVNRGP